MSQDQVLGNHDPKLSLSCRLMPNIDQTIPTYCTLYGTLQRTGRAGNLSSEKLKILNICLQLQLEIFNKIGLSSAKVDNLESYLSSVIAEYLE